MRHGNFDQKAQSWCFQCSKNRLLGHQAVSLREKYCLFLLKTQKKTSPSEMGFAHCVDPPSVGDGKIGSMLWITSNKVEGNANEKEAIRSPTWGREWRVCPWVKLCWSLCLKNLCFYSLSTIWTNIVCQRLNRYFIRLKPGTYWLLWNLSHFWWSHTDNLKSWSSGCIQGQTLWHGEQQYRPWGHPCTGWVIFGKIVSFSLPQTSGWKWN